jgi:uncharacterized DUF497 family protein
MDIDFEWDETKRLANRHKHGVDFADAVEVFYTRHTQVFGRDARPSHPIAALRLLAIVGL